MPAAVGVSLTPACARRALTASKRGGIGGFEREPGQARAVLVAPAGAGAVPDIAGDVMVIAPRRHEGRAMPAARDVEPEPVAIERLRAARRRRRADGRGRCAARRARRARPPWPALRRTMSSMSSGSVVIFRSLAGPLPGLRRAVAIDLDAVAFGVVEVEGLAHRVVGGAGERHLVARNVQDPAREVGARRHQERGVIEAGGARVVGLGIGPMLELEQGHAAGAERRARPWLRSSTASPSASR